MCLYTAYEVVVQFLWRSHAGTKLDDIMDHMGWRSPSTAHGYVKSNQVLHPGGAADFLSSLKIDLTDVYKELNDFPGLSQHSSRFFSW